MVTGPGDEWLAASRSRMRAADSEREQVIDLAGVSRSTFYVHFENKLEAALAAHEWVLERYLAEIQAACVAQGEWPMKVSAALGATVDFIVTRPRHVAVNELLIRPTEQVG